MYIRWTPAAADNFEHIKNYLSEHHPQFVQSTLHELYEAIRSLKAYPKPGRAARKGPESWCCRDCLTSLRIESKKRPSKSCTFIMARRTGRDSAPKRVGRAPPLQRDATRSGKGIMGNCGRGLPSAMACAGSFLRGWRSGRRSWRR